MLRLLTILSAPLLALPLVAAPVPKHLFPKDPPLYFPTTVGARWVYQEGATETTLVVEAIEVTAAGRVVTVVAVADGTSTPCRKVLVTPGGLSLLEVHRKSMGPAWVLLKVPHSVGDAWEVMSRPPVYRIRYRYTVMGTEVVSVPAGEFGAVRVDLSYTFLDKEHTFSFWYAPGVGEVKMADDGLAVRVLKSFTPGKD